MRHLRTHKVAVTIVVLGAAAAAGLVAVHGSRSRHAGTSPPAGTAPPTGTSLPTGTSPPGVTSPPATTSTSVPAASRVEVGVNLGGAGNAAFPSFPAAQQSQLMSGIAASGARMLRLDVPFVDEEPTPGRYDWTVADEVRRATAAGLEIDAVVDYPPAWARRGDGTPDPAAFASFAAAAAGALWGLGVHTYEIGNEPNLARFWGGPVSAAGYEALLADSYAEVHAAEATAVVVAGGLAETTSEGSLAEAPLPYLRQLYDAGLHGHFDALADHPYTFPSLPDPGDPANAFGALVAMRAVMVDGGDASKQIWLTEYGAPTGGSGSVSSTEQASMLSDAFAFAGSRPWIGPVFVFDWEDDSGDGDFGILDAGGVRKPAYAAVVAAASGAAP